MDSDPKLPDPKLPYAFQCCLILSAMRKRWGSSMTSLAVGRGCRILVALAISIVAQPTSACGATLRILHLFRGGTDGAAPRGGVVADQSGNLYGTTRGGGAFGFGTVFKLSPSGILQTLHSFDYVDGADPVAGVALDDLGNVYGTTLGGSNSGVVFKITSDGTETILHEFTGGADGDAPFAGLLIDKQENLFGTTEFGGTTCVQAGGGCGIVFQISPTGTETILYRFKGDPDGSFPIASLNSDKAGNLYGTTTSGGGSGNCSFGCGTVFKLSPDGTETILHAFAGGDEGFWPNSKLAMDKEGNFYGTTLYGGASNVGTVFKLAPNGTFATLRSFNGRPDGANPLGLTKDKEGNLYGVGMNGGTKDDGIVFELAVDGTETILANLGPKVKSPDGRLLRDSVGNFYGTSEGSTHTKSNQRGTVFVIIK